LIGYRRREETAAALESAKLATSTPNPPPIPPDGPAAPARAARRAPAQPPAGAPDGGGRAKEIGGCPILGQVFVLYACDRKYGAEHRRAGKKGDINSDAAVSS